MNDIRTYPLCVDLDDTLIETDVLWVGLRQLLRQKPWLILWFLFWLLLRRAAAKAWLAREYPLDAAILPYRKALLEYLQQQKVAGRKIYLVSAGDEKNVRAVANHLKLFDGAYGSDGKTNLKGGAKARFICDKLTRQFVYAGDSFADLQVWKEAAGAILCGKARFMRQHLPIPVEAVFA